MIISREAEQDGLASREDSRGKFWERGGGEVEIGKKILQLQARGTILDAKKTIDTGKRTVVPPCERRSVLFCRAVNQLID